MSEFSCVRHETVRSHHDTMDRLTTEASLTLVYLRLILPSRLCQWSRQALTTSLLSPTANVVLSQTPLNLITYAIFYCSQEVVFYSSTSWCYMCVGRSQRRNSRNAVPTVFLSLNTTPHQPRPLIIGDHKAKSDRIAGHRTKLPTSGTRSSQQSPSPHMAELAQVGMTSS